MYSIYIIPSVINRCYIVFAVPQIRLHVYLNPLLSRQQDGHKRVCCAVAPINKGISVLFSSETG